MKRKDKKILVTGGAGYIGSVLVPLLLQHNYLVRVLDNFMWGGESLLGVLNHPLLDIQKGDVRNTSDMDKALEGIEAVVHLAAIVGDPACRQEPDLATETNLNASVRLFEMAQEKGVERFVFASTCSNYGKMADPDQRCDETSDLKPVSHYARLKVDFEKHLLQSKAEICCVALRFSTAYGLSPRMRFDLTINELTRDAVLKRELVIFGEKFWRPYCHTVDLARSCFFVLQADKQLVHKQAINVGDDDENFQKQMIADRIVREIPDVQIQYVQQIDDPRDYRVSFSKIRSMGFVLSRRLPDGIREIRQAVENSIFADPYGIKHRNT